jgi:hypothetical protein
VEPDGFISLLYIISVGYQTVGVYLSQRLATYSVEEGKILTNDKVLFPKRILIQLLRWKYIIS